MAETQRRRDAYARLVKLPHLTGAGARGQRMSRIDKSPLLKPELMKKIRITAIELTTAGGWLPLSLENIADRFHAEHPSDVFCTLASSPRINSATHSRSPKERALLIR